MRINLLIFLCVVTVSSGWAQDESLKLYPSKIRYTHSYFTGMTVGESADHISGSLVTIQGIRFRKFNYGLGVGLEGYDEWRVVPLFASITYHFRQYDVNSLYMQFNAGHSFARRTATVEWFEYDDARGGVLLNPMIGYRFHKGGLNAYVSIGYKHQRLEQTLRQNNGSTIYYYSQKYTFERLFVQIGFGF